MKTCKYCGNKEKPNPEFDLAGYVCTECRPQCISDGCDNTNFPQSIQSKEWNDEEVVWCYSCGQIAPVEHIKQDRPVDGLPDGFDRDTYLGVNQSEL